MMKKSKKHMKTGGVLFSDVWKRPFTFDDVAYIWDKNNVMVFTFEDDIFAKVREDGKMVWDSSFGYRFVDLLNEVPGTEKLSGLEIKDGCDLYMGDKMLGCFRGWGHLTGTGRGCLNLTCEEAAEVQDEFMDDCLRKLQ